MRVLVISEFSVLSSGYSTYCKSLIQGLFNRNIEVAELATYCEAGDPRIGEIPWKVYPVMPHPQDPRRRIYDSDPQAVFGKLCLDSAVMDFKPDYVLTITDAWYINWIPFTATRDLFSWIHMPTVDAVGQNYEWLDLYNSCDGIVTYTDFSKKLLANEGNLFAHFECGMPASELFYPVDKNRIKASWGLNPDLKIVGFVSRNQRRKLFGDLMSGFSDFVKRTKNTDSILWLHTSFPDRQGWNLPRLIMDNELCSKVVLTYYCPCGHVFPSHFTGAKGFCAKCRRWTANTSNVSGAIPDVEMARIFNSFDLYVQYANSEGLGHGAIQAAACGVPVALVDYSAMEDVSTKLEGFKIPPKAMIEEIETGCLRAVPDNGVLSKTIEDFFDLPATLRKLKGQETRDNYVKWYSWDKTVDRWMEVMRLTPKKNGTLTIKLPAQITEDILTKTNNQQYVRWLFSEVLCMPEKLGTYLELKFVKDLQYGSTSLLPSFFYIEDSYGFSGGERKGFSRQEAYEFCLNLRLKNNNFIEEMRKLNAANNF